MSDVGHAPEPSQHEVAAVFGADIAENFETIRGIQEARAMSDKLIETKVLVPEGMRLEADEAIFEFRRQRQNRDLLGGVIRDITLEAALRWLSEYPMIPTDADMDTWGTLPPITDGRSAIKDFADWWGRRMFRAPQPDVPEVEDLMWHGHASSDRPQDCDAHNERILEAFRRGRKSVLEYVGSNPEVYTATPSQFTQLAKGCSCQIGCSVNGECPIHGDAARGHK